MLCRIFRSTRTRRTHIRGGETSLNEEGGLDVVDKRNPVIRMEIGFLRSIGVPIFSNRASFNLSTTYLTPFFFLSSGLVVPVQFCVNHVTRIYVTEELH